MGVPDITTADGLNSLRATSKYVNVEVGEIKPDDKNYIQTMNFLYSWVGFLVNRESSTRSFFLQNYVSLDETYYEIERKNDFSVPTLRPKKRNGSDHKTFFKWLDNPDRLTITEMELALAIFDIKSDEATLVWWLQREHRPHILWRIHQFLLSRYCFELLGPFRDALTKAGLDRAPFRAGELCSFHPRIGGLTSIGMIGLVNLSGFFPFFLDTATLPRVGIASLSSGGLLFLLLYLDVFKQNHGVMKDFSHALPRVFSVMRWFFVWGLMTAAVALLIRSASSGDLWEAMGRLSFEATHPVFSSSGIEEFFRRVLGICGLGTSAGTVGAILQWIWGDWSATEPI